MPTPFREDDGRDVVAQRVHDLAHVLARKELPIDRRQDPAPGIEQLHRIHPVLHFGLEVGDGGVGDFLKQRMGGFRLREGKRLGDVEVAASLPLHRVTENGPRRTRKADERDPVVQRLLRHHNGVHHVREGLFGVWDPHGFHVRRTAHGVGQVGALAGLHLKRQPHGLGHHQNVREQDGRVGADLVDRHDGDFRGELGGLAPGEEIVLRLELHEVRQVAACLAHDPDGRPWDGVAVQGLQKEVAHDLKCSMAARTTASLVDLEANTTGWPNDCATAPVVAPMQKDGANWALDAWKLRTPLGLKNRMPSQGPSIRREA